MESRTARADRPPLARPAPRGCVSVARGRRGHPHHSADARTRQHPANAALLERDRRGTQEGTGGELEQQRPTASPCIGKLIDLVCATDCPRFVPGNWKVGCGGGDLNPRPLGYEPVTSTRLQTTRRNNRCFCWRFRRRGGNPRLPETAHECLQSVFGTWRASPSLDGIMATSNARRIHSKARSR